MRRLWPLFAAICLAMALTGAAANPGCPVGVSMNIPEHGDMQTLARDLIAVKALGANVQLVSCSWRELEPKPGEYDLKPLLEPANGLASAGFTLIVTIKTLDTNNRSLPDDLQAKSFSDPAVVARFGRLVRAVIPQLPAAVKQISLGNEVDAYLGQHPDEVEPFARLMENGRAISRALRPTLPVGVTTTYDGLRDRPLVVARIDRRMDAVFHTYYPLGLGFDAKTPPDVAADFARMVHAANGKPLVLQEIGYPASTLLGSSDDRQADFVTAVFDALGKNHARIAAANFFLFYDFSEAQLDTFQKYYGIPDPRFRAFLATLGLKRPDTTPRPAWDRFVAGVR